MKKLLLSSLLLVSAYAFSQKDTSTHFIIADNTIGTVDMLKERDHMIEKVEVYNPTKALPESAKSFAYLADNGLSLVKFKKAYNTFDKVGIAEVNRWHNLPAETPILIDGYEINSKTVKIFVDIMQHAKVIQHNGSKVVSISTKIEKSAL